MSPVHGAGVAGSGEFAGESMPPSGTLVELFFQAVDEFDKPDAFLERSSPGWLPISHRELLERVHAVSSALARSGVERGDRVALLSENRWEWAVADYALLCSGALTVPIYSTLPAGQIVHIARDAGIRTIFVSTKEQLEKMLGVRAEVESLRTIITFDDTGSTEPGVITLKDFVAMGQAHAGSENDFRREASQAKPEDVATLIYTSGTTGVPKGVMLTHANLYSNAHASTGAVNVGPADIALSFLPLSHVLQRLVDYVMFAYGTTIAHLQSIDDVGAAFIEVQPTVAVAVPRVYEKLYARVLSETGFRRRIVLWARRVALDWANEKLAGRTPGGALAMKHAIADRLVFRKLREKLGGKIRFFISGGAPLPPEIALFFYGAGVLILEGYGLTETSPVTNVNTPEHLRIGTVGRPLPWTEEKIAEDGEILVRGPQIMKGYYRNPEATAQAVDEEGWFHTGDIGEIDADGYLRITDRKKELLVTSGGKNVAPAPMQAAMKRSRFIAESVLIGDRRPYVVAIVVPNFESLEAWAKPQGIPTGDRETLVRDERVERKLEEEMEARLGEFAHYERPKKVLAVAREFSLERGEITPTLKVKRRVIEEHLKDRIEALYAEPPPADH
jgi:long-chain acyl-CoA synthetase